MKKTTPLALLRALGLFSRFPDKRLSALSLHLEPLSFADGEEIFAEASSGDGLYLVASGRVRVTKRLAAVKDPPARCRRLLRQWPCSTRPPPAGAYAGGAV